MQDIATIEELENLLGKKLTVYYYPREIFIHHGLQVSAVCDELAKLVKRGHPEAVSFACKIIVMDPRLPFGKIIKSNFARALKRQVSLITDIEKSGIVKKAIDLLNMEFCPRELEDYCKLLKRFDSKTLNTVVGAVNPINEKSKRLIANLANG
jgi:hypothetical protein